jgi:hypothetical protein
MGKGSRRRKTLVTKEVADANYEGIFGKYIPPYLRNRTEEKDMQVRANPEGKIGSCGCGRSPTGNCIGWHGLTDAQLAEAQAKYQTENVKDTTQGG